MPVAAQTESPPAGSAATVVPPGEEPLGTSYAEWGARWWQWFHSVPAIEDPEAGDCQAGAGWRGLLHPPCRAGSVGHDRLHRSGPTSGSSRKPGARSGTTATTGWLTPDDLVALVEFDIPIYSDLAVSIDGEDVADIESYWVVNPGFTIEHAEGNPSGFTAGSWDAAMGGWFVMIPPLEPGSHTIVVHDALDLTRRRGGAAARRADGQRDRRARRVDHETLAEGPGRAPGNL